MLSNIKKYKTAVSVILFAVFFTACEGSLKDVQRANRTSFMPTGEADTIHLKYTDSGRIKSTLVSSKMLDYSHIENPFIEFPKGILVSIYENGAISTTIKSDYAISYKKTDMIDLQGNVVIRSQDGKKMETSQLYFDQKNEWFFTEKHFKYTDEKGGFLQGPGVDFSKDFKILNMQRSSGEVNSAFKP